MFELTTTWRLPVPAERAWQVITDAPGWPQWWPGISEVAVIAPGDASGVGRRLHVVVRSPLGYALRFGVEIETIDPPSAARARVVGDLVGEGTWAVVPDGAGCVASIGWHVQPTRFPLAGLTQIGRRPLAWAHAVVMKRGERALIDLLTK